MKRKILKLLFLIIIFSCKKEQEKSDIAKQIEHINIEDELKEDEIIEISVLNYQDTNDIDAINMWNDMIIKFEKEHPYIKIKSLNMFNEVFHEKLAIMALSNSLTDVIYLWPGNRTEQITKNNLVEDLKPLIERDGLTNVYNTSALAPQGINGEIFELPITLTFTHVFYINNKKLEKLGFNPPQTLNELKIIAEKLGESPIVMSNKDSWTLSSCLASVLLGRLAGSNWIKEAIQGKHKFTDPEFVKFLNLLKYLFDNKILSNDSLNLNYKDVVSEFLDENNNKIFLIDGDWKAQTILEDINNGIYSEEEKKNITFTVFPRLGDELNTNTSSMVAGVGMSIKSDLDLLKKEAAWTFVKFFAGKEYQLKRLKIEGTTPSYILNKTEIEALNLDTLINKRLDFTLFHNGVNVIDNYLSGQTNEVLNLGIQKLVLGAISPEELAKEIQNEFEFNQKESS